MGLPGQFLTGHLERLIVDPDLQNSLAGLHLQPDLLPRRQGNGIFARARVTIPLDVSAGTIRQTLQPPSYVTTSKCSP